MADYNTELVSTFVDNAATGSYSFASGPAAGVATQEFFMHLNGQAGNANSIAIDNVVASVPEPASVSLLALAGVGMLGRRRRA